MSKITNNPSHIFMANDFYVVSTEFDRNVYPHHYVSKKFMDVKIYTALEVLKRIEIQNISSHNLKLLDRAIEMLEDEDD